MPVDCISKGYKDLLSNLIVKKVSEDLLLQVLDGFPLCEPMPHTLSVEGAKELEKSRPRAVAWGIKVDYTNDKGEVSSFDSPSGLIKSLGLAMSGQQTLCDGQKCKAVDAVDIIRLQGYVVACEDEKGLTLDCKKAAAGGRAMHVFHPAVLSMKKVAFAKLPETTRAAIEMGKTYVRPA